MGIDCFDDLIDIEFEPANQISYLIVSRVNVLDLIVSLIVNDHRLKI